MAEKSSVENATDKLSELSAVIKQDDVSDNIRSYGPFYVHHIERYVRDPSHLNRCGNNIGLEKYDLYQATLSDASHKVKVLLEPKLYQNIQKRLVRCGDSVMLTRCSVHLDESDLHGSMCVTVHEMTVCDKDQQIQQVPCLDDLTWCPWSRCKDALTVSSDRGYLLDLWSSAELSSKTIHELGSVEKSESFPNIAQVSIADVAKNWSSVKKDHPCLVVRILYSNRMLHYAKPFKEDKWPFQCNFLVCDAKGICNLVLWNSMCPKYHKHLAGGSVILLQRFTVKKSFFDQADSSYPFLPNDLTYYDIDLNINSHHPVGEITLLDPAAIPAEIDLPKCSYKFITRKMLGSLPNDFICDVVGVVTHVGRFEREPFTHTNKYGHDSASYWKRRWLCIHDGTHKKPFVIQLYHAAELSNEQKITQGLVIAVRHCRLNCSILSFTTSKSAREPFLTTTRHSQIIPINKETEDTLSEAEEREVQNINKFMKTSEGIKLIQKCSLGGYFSYPSLPDSLENLQQLYTSLKITPCCEWLHEVKSTLYREQKRLFLQACLVAIRRAQFRSQADNSNGSPSEPSKDSPVSSPRKSARNSPRKQMKSQSSEVLVDDQDDQEEQLIDIVVNEDLLTAERVDTVGQFSPLSNKQAFPLSYDKSKWKEDQQFICFPPDGPDQWDDGYSRQSTACTDQTLIVTWAGLNSPTLLHTMLLLNKEKMDSISSVEDLLCCGSLCFPDSEKLEGNHNAIRSLHSTAAGCKDRRYLLVVDCYRYGADNVEIILNKCYPLS